jgi:hypothetical protein
VCQEMRRLPHLNELGDADIQAEIEAHRAGR